MAISPALRQALADGRVTFNARFVEARHRYQTLETSHFASFLQSGVDCVVRAVAVVSTDRIGAVTSAAYELALELVGQALAGPAARDATINSVWDELAPTYARLLAERPREVLSQLSNAGFNVERVQPGRAKEWIVRMRALAPHIQSHADLLAAGQVVAWRCGLAHFRTGALKAAAGLPEQTALTAIGAPSKLRWNDMQEKLANDPWWSPDREGTFRLQDRVEVGRFIGLGGRFQEPPQVRGCAEGFLVRSANRYSLLVADSFGATFCAATADEFDRGEEGRGLAITRLKLAGGSVDLDLPAEGLKAVGNAHTLAVTSPYTYAIRLLPRL